MKNETHTDLAQPRSAAFFLFLFIFLKFADRMREHMHEKFLFLRKIKNKNRPCATQMRRMFADRMRANEIDTIHPQAMCVCVCVCLCVCMCVCVCLCVCLCVCAHINMRGHLRTHVRLLEIFSKKNLSQKMFFSKKVLVCQYARASPHACAVIMMTNGNPTSDGTAGNDPDGNPDPIIHL